MAGHSKWAGIKHKKAIVDARRGKLFTKLARAITVAAKEGGGDVDGNPSLALAVQKAKDASMPKDNIERAIAKGTGEGSDADALETVLYEGYGPGGVAILMETLTDNRNRTVGEIRHILTKWAGNLGAANSVARLFSKRSVISIAKEKASEETLMEALLEAGADDLRDDGAAWEIVSAPEHHAAVVEAVKKLGIEPDNAEVAMVPSDYIKLEGKQAQQMLKLMEALEDHDDTKNVWSNFDVDEKEIEASLA